MLTRIGLTAALLAGLAVPASAQIYTWRDGNGHLVLSDQPPRGEAVALIATYDVPKAENVRVTRFVAVDRARNYEELIVEQARLNGVRPALVRAVVQVESAFDPNARSRKGALGLMQLMPATARQFGVTNPFNPNENVRAGVAYLRQLLDRYGNNEELALAAYNAGPGAVAKYGEIVPPFRETRNYVLKVNQIAGTPARTPGSQIYKVTRIIDGREVVLYTDRKPE